MYFDKETGLLAKFEHRAKDATGKEVSEERIVLEYRDTDGVKTAKKAQINHDGAKFLEVEILEAKILDKLDDSEFEMP